ncbi:NAD(P)-dependent oxidoreductase, partial [Paenibacillus sp. 28ISP30-2]|nr:NAD(P)-dependent oxidoreductase [Paenibacillus sp. 28ISP30-2]
MQHFVPISLNCKNKLCCIVGGGRIAERKVKGLMESGAFITVRSGERRGGRECRARG